MDISSAAPAAALIQRGGGQAEVSMSSIKHEAQLESEVVNMAFQTAQAAPSLPLDGNRGRGVNISA